VTATGLTQRGATRLSACRTANNVAHQETPKEHQGSCTKTQLSAHRACAHSSNRNYCEREAHSYGCSSTDQRSVQHHRSLHCTLHTYVVSFPLQIHSNTLGKRFGMEFDATHCPCRAGPTMGCGNTAVCHLAKPSPSLSLKHYCRFQVEEGSNLYYDPSPLLEYQKEDKQAVPNPAEGLPSSSSNPHPVQRGPPFPMAGHHSTNGVIMSPIVATPTRHGIPGQMGGPYGGPQFNAIPPVQFYGVDRNSPMTRGMSMGMGMEGMGITPDVRSLSRRM
jgi:hypothetical protein